MEIILFPPATDGIFVGYAGYYLLRKNFSLAMPYLIAEGYSKTDLGLALSGVAIAYGLSRFFMGNVSDRSNARIFMSLALLMSALTMTWKAENRALTLRN